MTTSKQNQRSAANSAENSKPKRRGNPDKLKPYQFQPGQSGNPNGRPKKKPLTEMYERLLNDPETAEAVEKSVRAIILGGRMASVLQLKEMAERVEGKVAQDLKLGGEVKVSIAEAVRKVRERKAEYERSR